MATPLTDGSLPPTQVANEVEKKSRLEKFARAAKLLRAMRAQVVVHKNQKMEGSSQVVLKTFEELKEESEGERYQKVLDLKDAFDNFDDDKSNELSLEELSPLLASMGLVMPDEEVKQMVTQLDLNQDGKVSFQEFAHRMLADEEEIGHEEAAREIFEMIDKDGSGELSLAELTDAFKDMKTGLKDDEIQSIISQLDDDDSGQIGEDEFVNALVKIFEEEE